MKRKNLLRKLTGCIICILLIIANYSESVQQLRTLPDNIYISLNDSGSALPELTSDFLKSDIEYSKPVDSNFSESLKDKNGYDAELSISLFGIIPVKQVSLHYRDSIRVMPGGMSVGVRLYTSGALVVGTSAFESQQHLQVCPALEAGLKSGDVITSINGETVDDADTMREICALAGGNTIVLTYIRDGIEYNTSLGAQKSADDGAYRMGMWVRDSTAGIGTLSFFDMNSYRFGALGHAITDVDVGEVLRVRTGEILDSSVLGIAQGSQGVPGEIKGTFNGLSKKLGSIEQNTELGIFGTMSSEVLNPLYPEGVELGYPDDAHTGSASILTTIDTEGVKEFDCEIIKVFSQTSASTKSMVVQITDDELIAKTGGIIQGMSGSPIIQDGKLIGVVTHVFVNDPQKGYCIYALWMYEQSQKHN